MKFISAIEWILGWFLNPYRMFSLVFLFLSIKGIILLYRDWESLSLIFEVGGIAFILLTLFFAFICYEESKIGCFPLQETEIHRRRRRRMPSKGRGGL